MNASSENGIVTIPSHHSVDATIAKAETILQKKGNAPEYLQVRHHLPAELLQNISVVGALAEAAAE